MVSDYAKKEWGWDFRMKTDRQISAGGVIFRRIDNNAEIALIAVKDGKVWCLPK